jgi:hypothetical protein
MSQWRIRSYLVIAFIGVFGMLATSRAASGPRARGQVEEDIRKIAEDDAAADQRNVDLAVRMFSDEARQAGMQPRELMTIYQEAYRREHERRTPSPWDTYKFRIVTVVAVVMAIIAVFRKSLEDLLAKLFGVLWTSIYSRYAGSKALRRLALTRYRSRLIPRLTLLRLPFRPGLPLDVRDIYVPLRAVALASENTRVSIQSPEDAFEAIARHRRLVVLGAPGAGKSMLLKHVALLCAERRLPITLPPLVPVLIELRRLAEPKATIEAEIVAELNRNGFPHADTFVKHNLDRGSLLVLFDGIDELPVAQRMRVVQLIKDLVTTYQLLRIVVSCRVAVYKGELHDVADQTLELIDFNDQQIRAYLRSWAPSMSDGKSVDELINTLANRPEIKKLAGSPLLLTIIAYLYADHPEIVLPHSRSQFYKIATDQLLERWHYEHNRFTLPQKRAILEHLALLNQAGTGPSDADRRTMDFRAVTTEVQALCPSLNLKPEAADEVLGEIVERSGLLLTIDGGQRYSFAHLTLQEYFTAAKLQQDPHRVILQYEADRDGWRETLRLWCGLAPDSTNVIRKAREIDPLIAFECLADAHVVSPELADETVAELKRMFVANGRGGERIQVAFGTVASDPRPRGAQLFTFLVDCLDDPERRLMAANALSRTSLARAASALGQRLESDLPELRSALIAMSDLAVPVLAGFVAKGHNWALDDLRAIGTSSVAEALVPLLWSASNKIAVQAALTLGNMLRQPHIEAALQTVALAAEQRSSRERLEWVWRPFDRRELSPLSIIASRMAFLVDRADERELKPVLDERIVIPVWITQLGREPRCANQLRRQRPAAAPLDLWLERIGASTRLGLLLRAMAPDVQKHCISNLQQGHRAPTPNDWMSMLQPTSYHMVRSWHIRIYILIVLSLCIPTLLEVVRLLSSAPFVFTFANVELGFYAVLLTAMILFGLAYALFVWPATLDAVVWAVFCSPTFFVLAARRIKRILSDRVDAMLVLLAIMCTVWIVPVWYHGRRFLFRNLIDGVVIAWFAISLVCCTVLLVVIRQREVASQNPLFRLWDRQPRTMSQHVEIRRRLG